MIGSRKKVNICFRDINFSSLITIYKTILYLSMCIKHCAFHSNQYSNLYSAVKVLFTTPYTKSVMSLKDQKHYAHIEAFEDYDTTGLIEYMAIKLHKQFGFTHVSSRSQPLVAIAILL